MVGWHQLAVHNSTDEFDDYRDESMCCSAIFHKVDFDNCRVCAGEHTMTERRLRCLSSTCREFGKCGVVWKVLHCTAQDKWQITVNEQAHARGVLPCTAEHRPVVTQPMKAFIAAQDEIGNAPRIILAHLKRQANKPSKGGWPELSQIQNALKVHRRSKGTKNSIKAVHEMARARRYKPELQPDSAFLFGPKLDTDGFVYVGSGEDDDPFIIGVTSLALIDSCLRFCHSGEFVQFHADATFKASDLGYPVITCCFTDRGRSYQVGAFFVVSRRTEHEYTECLRSFADVVRHVRGATLRIDATMTDAEDAQFLALENVPSFANATKLMCYFHVMYNVRKRTQHLPFDDRKNVMNSIVDIHFTQSLLEFERTRDREIANWRKHAHLVEFADYFEQQWLKGRYWRWQLYHNPEVYALTNNPCENLNGGLKHFFQRRKHHMCRLLEKIGTFIETTSPVKPAPAEYTSTPTSELVKTAAAMLEASRVVITRTTDANQVRVLEILRADTDEQAGEENGFLLETINAAPSTRTDTATGPSSQLALFLALTSTQDNPTSDSSDSSTASDIPAILRSRVDSDEHEDDEVVTNWKRLFEQATSWSLRRSHRIGMPSDGWLVDITRKRCTCPYFLKMLMCWHVVAVLRKFNITSSVRDPLAKLKNRIVAKAKAKRSGSKRKQTKAKKSKGKASRRKTKSTNSTTATTSSAACSEGHPGLVGRPAHAAPALAVQDILLE